MRPFGSSVLCSAFLFALSGASWAQGTEVATRGPRFLMTSPTEPKPLDISRVPVLRQRITLDLHAATLERALREIGRQSGLRFVYSQDVIPLGSRINLQARSITVAAALTELLVDAGVDVVLSSGGQAMLTRRSENGGIPRQQASIAGRVTDGKTGEELRGVDISLEGTRWRTLTGDDGRYRLLEVAPGRYTVVARRIGYRPERRAVAVTAGQETTLDVVALEPAPTTLSEVVVTAEKREGRLQEVPVPVTAIRAEQLVNSNQPRLQDYYAKIPGLSLVPPAGRYYGGSMIAIRGLVTGYGNPTVALMVDDVPYGAATGAGFGTIVPEIDPSDIAHIEVLRGPQGTLYGASSIGGLLKYVTINPSTDRVSGRLQTGSSSVSNGGELGYSVSGAVNVPINARWAVRASGFTRRDPGYINDPVHGVDGVNWGEVAGGRLSTLWRPSDALSLKLGALLQDSKTHGLSVVHVQPGLGDLQQSVVPGSEGYHRKLQVYSADVTAELGRVGLTAVSAYAVDNPRFLFDFTPAFGGIAQSVFGVAGAPAIQVSDADKFSQEVRLSGPIGSRVEWLLGAFYAHQDAVVISSYRAADFMTGALAGEFGDFNIRTTVKEYAAFANLTYHATERFDVQIGARESRTEQTSTQAGGGIFGNGVFGPVFASKDNALTYLVTPRFTVSRDLTVYARFASGYRPGGPNGTAGLPGVPFQYSHDKTQNLEIGVKGSLLNALTFDASLYHVDWKDLQLSLATTQAAYTGNGSEARSRGVELSVESTPLNGLRVGAWGAWNDAELTEDLPATSTALGQRGDRLPFSSRFSGSVSLDQEIRLASRVLGFIGGSMSYVGDRRDGFQSTFTPLRPRLDFPGYTKADVRAGVRYDSWEVNLYANNITDERGILAGGYHPPYTSVNPIQPRTVGVFLSRTF